MIRDVNLEQKITDAAGKTTVLTTEMTTAASQDDMMMPATPTKRNQKVNEKAGLSKKNLPMTTLYVAGNVNTVSQVAGIIIGSPEFQRK